MNFHGIVHSIDSMLRGRVEMELLEGVRQVASQKSARDGSGRKLEGLSIIFDFAGRGRVVNLGQIAERIRENTLQGLAKVNRGRLNYGLQK